MRDQQQQHRRWLRPVGALATGVLLAVSYSLEPLWFAAWFAPVPLLLAACGTTARRAFTLGSLAGLLGSTTFIGYMSMLGGPVDAALIILLRALQWGLFALAARAAFRGLPDTVGIFVLPALFAGSEIVIAELSPHGTGGSIAYSQLDALPVAQLASLGGVAMIVFALGLFANLVVYSVLRWRVARSAVPTAAGVLALLLGFGSIHLATAPQQDGPRVALIASNEFKRADKDNWRPIWAAYVPAIERAAREQGAEIVVLPEKLVRIDAAEVGELLAEASNIAVTHRIQLIIGVDERGDAAHNRAYLVTVNGEIITYDKRHMIPGIERDFDPGTASVTAELDGVTAGLIICKDLDFPHTVREYADADAGLLLVPAWDFDVDAWYHSRMAALRGIENGMSVARAAPSGLLTVSDSRGTVLAEQPVSGDVEVLTATTTQIDRVPTVYAVIGDAFGWVALVFAGGALVVAVIRRDAKVTSE